MSHTNLSVRVIDLMYICVVAVPPEVSLKVGHGIDLSTIKEGDDVVFECHVSSNPPTYHVTWFRDVRY